MTREKDEGVVLMLAYQRGDESAFDRIVEVFSGRVYSLLTRFLGPVSEREDLVQEVFLRVIRARRSYQPTARFSTWLYRIAFNLSANERERKTNRPRLIAHREAGANDEGQADWADARTPDPSKKLERDDVVEAVRRAIADLPERQRMALILAKYEELPYGEVAAALESTEKAVKSMIHRARESLRATLAPFLAGELV